MEDSASGGAGAATGGTGGAVSVTRLVGDDSAGAAGSNHDNAVLVTDDAALDFNASSALRVAFSSGVSSEGMVTNGVAASGAFGATGGSANHAAVPPGVTVGDGGSGAATGGRASVSVPPPVVDVGAGAGGSTGGAASVPPPVSLPDGDGANDVGDTYFDGPGASSK